MTLITRDWRSTTDGSPGRRHALASRSPPRGNRLHPDGTKRRHMVLMHRFILDPAGSMPRSVTVDHRDGDGLNNTRSNLKLIDAGTNVLHRRGPFSQ
jgi:hypothetical protein